MSPIEEEDTELAELRQRRIQEILGQRSSAPAAPPPPAAPVELTAQSFPQFLAAHPRVVVDVWAPWCAPCRAVAPVLDALAKRFAVHDVRFTKLNADEEPQMAAQWGVTGIPTLLLFQESRLIDRLVGAYPGEVIDRRLRTAFRLPNDRAPREADE